MRDHDSHCQKKAMATSARPRLRRLKACQQMKPMATIASHHRAGLPPS